MKKCGARRAQFAKADCLCSFSLLLDVRTLEDLATDATECVGECKRHHFIDCIGFGGHVLFRGLCRDYSNSRSYHTSAFRHYLRVQLICFV